MVPSNFVDLQLKFDQLPRQLRATRDGNKRDEILKAMVLVYREAHSLIVLRAWLGSRAPLRAWGKR